MRFIVCSHSFFLSYLLFHLGAQRDATPVQILHTTIPISTSDTDPTHPFQLSLNRSGFALLLYWESAVFVVELSRRVRAELLAGSDPNATTLALASYFHASHRNIRVIGVEWAPNHDLRVGALYSDQVWRLFDLEKDAETPILSINLRDRLPSPIVWFAVLFSSIC